MIQVWFILTSSKMFSIFPIHRLTSSVSLSLQTNCRTTTAQELPPFAMNWFSFGIIIAINRRLCIHPQTCLHSLWTKMVGQTFNLKHHCHYLSLDCHEEKVLCRSKSIVSVPSNDNIAKFIFHISKTLLYSNSGLATLAKVINIAFNDAGTMIICVKTTLRLQGRNYTSQITQILGISLLFCLNFCLNNDLRQEIRQMHS